MVDPYEFIVRESAVSSSQEEVLKRIPGWQVQQEVGSPSSPSQTPLALSRLCGSGSSSSSDDRDEEERELAPASAFCMQEPLEWASPEACYDDSYNPAFESDRSRSLSPLAPLHLYGDLWASRLITQSQNDGVMSHLGICDLPLAEEAAKMNPPQEAEAGFDPSYRQQKNVRLFQGTSGQAQPVSLSDTHKQVGVTPSRDIPNGSYSSVDCEKDCNGKLQNVVEPLKVGATVASLVDHTAKKKCVNVSVDEPGTVEATVRSRINSTAAEATSCCIVENVRKRKDEGASEFATTAQKVKFLKEPNYEQQHGKLANEANHCNVGPQPKKQLGEDYVAGSSNTKCLLPFVFDKENNISNHRLEKSASGETDMVKDNVAMDRSVMRLFPESVMDVMMLVSEVLPTPSPRDPDFLSIVMSTGVSLPLPFRDCSGRLISKKPMI